MLTCRRRVEHFAGVQVTGGDGAVLCCGRDVGGGIEGHGGDGGIAMIPFDHAR